MRILELFAGIGACSKALENLGIDLEIVDAVEIDKYAIKSFNAIHGTNFEVQDICEWDKDLKDIDIITHGSPCQDFSVAGKQAGGDIGSGTRSSLMYETIRIVGKIRPKYVLWENVKNLLSKKHKHNFDAYIETMNILGYNSYYQVLDAKDYEVPQHRERVYTVSIRKDIDNGNFKFPEKQELKLRLKDMLEEYVDEKYYLSDKMIEGFQQHNKNHIEKGTGFIWKTRDIDGVASALRANGALCPTDNTINVEQVTRIKLSTYNVNKKRIQEKDTLCARDWKDPKCVQVGKLDIKGIDQIKRVYSDEGLSPTLTNMQGGNRQPKIIEEPSVINPLKGISGYSWQFEQQVYDKEGIARSIKANGGSGNIPKILTENLPESYGRNFGSKGKIQDIEKNIRIRKLIPKECWRLMGFDDEDFEKAEKVNSNTQLYKQAGNSIVVKVLEEIFKNILK